jgi:hypothetical protein
MEASLAFPRDRERSIGLVCFAVLLLVSFAVAGVAITVGAVVSGVWWACRQG